MLRQALQHNTSTHGLIRLILACALVFAALHVSLHDLDTHSDVDDADICQVCRIHHVPAVSVPLPALSVPLQLVEYILPLSDFQFRKSSLNSIQWARPPPVLIDA